MVSKGALVLVAISLGVGFSLGNIGKPVPKEVTHVKIVSVPTVKVEKVIQTVVKREQLSDSCRQAIVTTKKMMAEDDLTVEAINKFIFSLDKRGMAVYSKDIKLINDLITETKTNESFVRVALIDKGTSEEYLDRLMIDCEQNPVK